MRKKHGRALFPFQLGFALSPTLGKVEEMFPGIHLVHRHIPKQQVPQLTDLLLETLQRRSDEHIELQGKKKERSELYLHNMQHYYMQVTKKLTSALLARKAPSSTTTACLRAVNWAGRLIK